MIHIAIVEDEILYSRQLQDYIARYQAERGQQIRVTVFSDGEDIVENYRGDYDLILLDIQMQFMDGMTAAEKIREMDQEVMMMFITNMTQYAIRGYQVDAMDYVVKPVEYFAFSQKLDKAISRMKKRDQVFLKIPTEDGVQKLNLLDIYYVESRGHNVIYNTRIGTCVSRAALKELEEELAPYGFFRCSKGYLVNMHILDGVSGNDCVVKGEKIPISRSKKKEFMEKLLDSVQEGGF